MRGSRDRVRLLAVAAAAAVALTAGCARHDGGGAAPENSARPAGRAGTQPSGYDRMREKADSAESAAAAADSDAASDDASGSASDGASGSGSDGAK